MKRIRDLRSRPIGTVSVPVDASIDDAAGLFRKHDVSGLVVLDGEKLVGIFTKNDLVRCCCDNPDGHRDRKVAEYMTRDVCTVDIGADLDEVAERMVQGNFRHVPVMENGRVVGMVTPIDVLIHQRHELTGERDDLMRYIQGVY